MRRIIKTQGLLKLEGKTARWDLNPLPSSPEGEAPLTDIRVLGGCYNKYKALLRKSQGGLSD
jgi:hypothetical protein